MRRAHQITEMNGLSGCGGFYIGIQKNVKAAIGLWDSLTSLTVTINSYANKWETALINFLFYL